LQHVAILLTLCDLGVKPRPCVDAAVDREMSADALATERAHAAPVVFGARERKYRLSELDWVVRGHQYSGLVVDDELAHSAHGGRDDRKVSAHRFQMLLGSPSVCEQLT
jgi:hypothetical protein